MVNRLTFLLVAIGILFVGVPGQASQIDQEFQWNNVTYLKMSDGWYAKGINDIFKVMDHSISARLADTDNRDTVMAILADKELTFVRENRLNIMDIHLPTDSDIMKTVKELDATGLFKYVEPNVYGKWSAIPNDPGFSQCYGLHNTGQSGGTPDADMNLVDAWDIATGDPGIIVAVLDSGTEVTHSDLAGNIWNNPGEIPGNNIDDDGNGRIDDIVGWDFEFNDNDPSGSYYHGTHVAGCVAAVNNNGVGLSAPAGGWNSSPGASMLICMVGSSAPIGEIIDDAILYSADHGARVITLSLSVSESTAINDAATDAYAAGSFIDCASGNDYSSVAYPASLPEICAVGATDRDDVKADFSNYGPELELTSPGVDIYSTQLGNTYGTSSGTSFAAPYVAGVAALILSAAPSLTNQELRELMWNTANDLGDPGFDNLYGYGRVDALAALQQTSGVYLEADFYPCQDNLLVTVRDNSSTGSIDVTVSSTTESAGETLTLTEVNPGEFTGSITLDSIPVQSGDSIISVSDGDSLTVLYSSTGETATAEVDCGFPTITNVTVDGISDNEATIHFTTDEPCYGSVMAGTPSPDMQFDSMTLTTTHTVFLSGLTDCANYEFYVMASDPAGNMDTDDNGGSNYSFITLDLVVLLEADMEEDPGWSYDGAWEYGDPLGNDGDPDNGYTGTNVIGYNLAGDYENNIAQVFCTTTAFDCAGATDVYFSFYKWLGIESSTYDHASIQVSNNNGSDWTTIWDHDEGTVQGGSWEYVEFDISNIASGYNQVLIRWVMGATDSSVTYCGWNIDDVLVSYTQDCVSECNNDGDTNLDGTITAGDAQVAFQIALGLYSPNEDEACAADCNGDESVTAGDAQQIFTTALGLDNCADPM